ncbi:protein TolR [Novispirillum sp. DQ9]|uniref:protein TolR n=1 Tax=Novispirillum sp. DQ9 TaxID=3398612 RepID=UPI003C7BA862
MGMFVQSGGGRGGRRSKRRPMSEINVTPLVDVMLVLLIIFMVTAPLLTTGVQVDLPAAKAPQLREQDIKALEVSVAADGTVYLQETAVTLDKLPAMLAAVKGANAESRIYVRGDSTIDYGRVMQVLSTLHEAGYHKAALITRPGAATTPPKGR